MTDSTTTSASRRSDRLPVMVFRGQRMGTVPHRRHRASVMVVMLVVGGGWMWLIHWASDPHRLIGLSGVIPVMLVLATALYGGPILGAVTGLVLSSFYVVVVAFDSPPDPVFFGLPIIVVWTAGAAVAGWVADDLRSRVLVATSLLEAERDRAAEMANKLQAAILPTAMPKVPGAEFGVFFRPAGDGSELGGDFYDAWRRPDGSFGFAIGDVCGKGAAAAAVTALARHTLRTASMLGASPAESLRALNDALLRRTVGGRFVTAISGVGSPHPAGWTIRLACGGHPVPLLIGRNGEAAEFGRPGTLLGTYEMIEIHETEALLEYGETLVCYTDGITDIRVDNERFGEARLVASLANHPHAPAEQLVESLGAAYSEFGPASPQDDAAVLAIRATGQPTGHPDA